MVPPLPRQQSQKRSKQTRCNKEKGEERHDNEQANENLRVHLRSSQICDQLQKLQPTVFWEEQRYGRGSGSVV